MALKLCTMAGLALAGVGAISLITLTTTTCAAADDKPLGHYDSTTKDFWLHPPDDWWRGDETEAQRGLVPNPGQPLPTPLADLEKIVAGMKAPPGFKVTIYASNVPQARQMAWGDKGTLFVGTWDAGVVNAIADEGGKRMVKPVIKGLRMATGVAYNNHTLYVVDIDKVYAWENPEDHLDNLGPGKVVYDDLPPYTPHGWKYITVGQNGELYIPVGPTSACRPAARPRFDASILKTAMLSCGRSAFATASAARWIRGPAFCGSARMLETGSATTFPATS